jgi:hypothetical protein
VVEVYTFDLFLLILVDQIIVVGKMYVEAMIHSLTNVVEEELVELVIHIV